MCDKRVAKPTFAVVVAPPQRELTPRQLLISRPPEPHHRFFLITLNASPSHETPAEVVLRTRVTLHSGLSVEICCGRFILLYTTAVFVAPCEVVPEGSVRW